MTTASISTTQPQVVSASRRAPLAPSSVSARQDGARTTSQDSSAATTRWTFLACSRGRLPFRLVVFLDWACEAGLLRYAGTAYRFRHRELQQWLAAHPDPAPTPLNP